MTIVTVPVTKGKGVVEIDTDSLPEDVWSEVVLQGLKTILNRGMAKVTVAELGSEEGVRQEAMIIAEQNVSKMKEGKIKFSGKATKASAIKMDKAVASEALRIAKDRIRDAIKASGKKLYAVKAADITSAAKELIASDESIVKAAEEAIKARSAVPSTTDLSAIIGGLKEDQTKIAKAEAEKAEAKKNKPLSAKQAGQTVKAKGKTKIKPPVAASADASTTAH